MKVLVMGGTRFNGLHLVHELVRQGHQVSVFNRGVTEAELPREVHRLYGDRKNREQLREVLGREDFDCIQDTSAYTLEEVQGVVELARGRVGHYLFTSSTVVYASSQILPITEEGPLDRSPGRSEYSRNKLLCEDFLFDEHRRSGFPVTIARLAMVFGPHNTILDREQLMFVRLLRGRKILIPGRGTTLGQTGHVDDQARALCLMMMNPRTFGQVYTVTGNQYWTDTGYVDTFAKVVGVEAKKVFVPDAVMEEVFATGARRPLIQRFALDIHRWDESTLFSIEKLKSHLGFEPRYSFEAAVEQTYEWFRREGRDKTASFDFGFEDELLRRLGASW